jgi:hypothetical protein
LPTEEVKEEEGTKVEKLLELCSSFFLFHDQREDEYVFLDRHAIALSSKKFRKFLSKK